MSLIWLFNSSHMHAEVKNLVVNRSKKLVVSVTIWFRRPAAVFQCQWKTVLPQDTSAYLKITAEAFPHTFLSGYSREVLFTLEGIPPQLILFRITLTYFPRALSLVDFRSNQIDNQGYQSHHFFIIYVSGTCLLCMLSHSPVVTISEMKLRY